MSKLVEEWRPVVGYEGYYEVSDWGNVRSTDRYTNFYLNGVYKGKRLYKGKTIRKYFNKLGYLRVELNKNGEKKHFSVHRLVAEAFLPNPENKPFVGHLKTMENGLEDKTANEAWNIQWMTPKENRNYGTLNERISASQKGREFTEEHKKNLSESLKKSERLHILMKSNEYLEKLSNSHKGKQLNREDLSIPVKQTYLDGKFVASYPSAKEAARQTGFAQSNISRCCKGGFFHKGKWINVNSAYGFKWTY